MDYFIDGVTSALGSTREIVLIFCVAGLFILAICFIVTALQKLGANISSFEIIKFGTPIKRKYKEIGRITVEDMGRNHDMMKELVRRAKKIGASGVIILPPPNEVYDIKLEGIAIKYI